MRSDVSSVHVVAEAAAGKDFTGTEARRARERAGLSQFQVAVELGITPQHVSNFEREQSNLSPKARYKLAQLLGLPLPDYVEPPVSKLDLLEADMAEIRTQLGMLTAAVEALIEETRSLRRAD